MTPSPFRRRPPQPGEPEPITGPPARGAAPPPPRNAPPPPPDESADQPDSGVKLDMLGYRDGSKHCETCSHFDGDSACDLDATTPVDAAGGCEAHSPAGGDQSDQPEPDADDVGNDGY